MNVIYVDHLSLCVSWVLQSDCELSENMTLSPYLLFIVAVVTVSTTAATSASQRMGRSGEDLRLPRDILPRSYEVTLLPILIEGNFTTEGYVSISVDCIQSTNNITLHIADIIFNPVDIEVSLTHKQILVEVKFKTNFYSKVNWFGYRTIDKHQQCRWGQGAPIFDFDTKCPAVSWTPIPPINGFYLHTQQWATRLLPFQLQRKRHNQIHGRFPNAADWCTTSIPLLWWA